MSRVQDQDVPGTTGACPEDTYAVVPVRRARRVEAADLLEPTGTADLADGAKVAKQADRGGHERKPASFLLRESIP